MEFELTYLVFYIKFAGYRNQNVTPAVKSMIIRSRNNVLGQRNVDYTQFMKNRRSKDGIVKRKGDVTSVRYLEDFNDFELGRPQSNHIKFDTVTSFRYEQLKSWIPEDVLNKAIQSNGQPYRLTGGAPGEEAWESMKSEHKIQFYEVKKWYCLPNGICSCLSFLAEYHSSPNIRTMIQNLVQLGEGLEKVPMNVQCNTIAEIYNETKKEYPIAGLGEAKVIKKRRRLEKIKKMLKDPVDKMITAILVNHAVTCFNHYIFDSTQTHALHRTEENLRFVFGKTFSISYAIEYSHNGGQFKMFEKIIKRR